MIDAYLFEDCRCLEAFCWMLDGILTTGGGDILVAARGGAFRFDGPVDVTTPDPVEDEIEQRMEDKYHIYQNPGFAKHVYSQARRCAERLGVKGIARNDDPVHGLEDLLGACKVLVEGGKPAPETNGPGQAGRSVQDTPVEQKQLENGAHKILRMLGSSPTRLLQEDLALCEDPPMDRRTVSRHLKTLAERGLIDYNPPDKKGAGITQKGKDYLNSLPK